MRRAPSRFRPTAAVAVAGVLATAVVAQIAVSQLEASARERLDQRASLVTQAVQSEVERYEDALGLVAAAAGSTPDFTQDQFDAAVAPLGRMGLTGATGVVFVAPPVGERGVARLEQHWRARGARGLHLVPAEGHAQHVFAIMGRRLDESVPTRTGVDLAASPAPYTALVRSAHEGGSSMTPPYTLGVQGRRHGPRQVSFSITVPVRHDGLLRGWVLMGIRGQDFAGGVLSRSTQGAIGARLTAPDERGRPVEVADVAPSYSDPLDVRTTDRVRIAQRRWTVTSAASAHQTVPLMRFAPWPLVTLCLFLTMLLALLVHALSSGRTRAEVRAREADEKLLGVTTRLEDLIWSAEARLDGSMPLLFANSATEAALALAGPTGEDLAVRLRDRTLAEDLPRLEVFLDALGRGDAAEVETRVRSEDGTVRWMWSRGFPRRDGARLVVDGITSDVHRRKVLDQQRTQFLAIAGHEMRTPLTIIRGYAEYLMAEDDDPIARRRGLEAIGRRSRQMEQLLSDFFDVSRLEAGVVGLERRPLRLDQVLRTARDDFEETARAQGVGLALTAEPATVSADPIRLRQVVDNLLDNAVKYSRPGGTVRVTVDHLDRVDGGDVRLVVSDDGIGVPPEEVGLIFDRFYRASNAEHHVANGTGLGLSVVAAIVQGHGGGIRASSPPGQGLTVTVTLPAADPAPADEDDGTVADAMMGA